jgi:hypothetical protein
MLGGATRKNPLLQLNQSFGFVALDLENWASGSVKMLKLTVSGSMQMKETRKW